jgi:hypothetical protein
MSHKSVTDNYAKQRKTKMALHQPGNFTFDEGLTQAPDLNRAIDNTEPDEPTGAGRWIHFIWFGLFLWLCMCCILAMRSYVSKRRFLSTQEEQEMPPEVRRKNLTEKFVKSGNQMVRVENRRILKRATF